MKMMTEGKTFCFIETVNNSKMNICLTIIASGSRLREHHFIVESFGSAESADLLHLSASHCGGG